MGQTTIEWTDLTVNPIRARLNGATGHHCVKLSAGCAHCYSSRMQARFGMPPFEADKRRDVEAFFDEKPIRALLTRRKPAKVFWCDMTDLFGEWVPDEWIDRCFAVMFLTPRLTHQVLTKRPERMRAYVTSRPALDPGHVSIWTEQGCQEVNGISEGFKYRVPWPLQNVMLGVSIENQETADARIPLLLQTPAAARFVSAEPLLGSLNIAPFLGQHGRCPACGPVSRVDEDGCCLSCGRDAVSCGLDLAIVGGESGPHARPMHPDWPRSLRDQCQAAGVPYFFKQWGAWQEGSKLPGWTGEIVLRDGRHGATAEALGFTPGRAFEWGQLHPTKMARVGKKAAGNLLDGQSWQQWPEGREGQ